MAVLLRTDFNVPIVKGRVGDDFKIKRALPTIKLLLKNKNKLVLVSHLGRPKGKRVKALSLEPVYKYLRKELKGVKIEFVKNKTDLKLVKKVNNSFAQIVMLENMRYDRREDEGRKNLAQLLAKMADVYVNEAFAASHREMASLATISNYLTGVAGLNLQKEVEYLSKALKPRKPSVALIGGAKIHTKIAFLKKFLTLYNRVLVGGGLANTFLLAKGYKIGESICEPTEVRRAKLLLKSFRLVLPVDVVIADQKTMNQVRVARVGRSKKLCNEGEIILDIGPETVIKFAQIIRKSKFVVWNGPMGLIEKPKFSHGTIALAKIIGARASSHRAVCIAGGGETLLALDMSKMGRYYDFVSTGGGAMLQFLEGKKLAGLKVLK